MNLGHLSKCYRHQCQRQDWETTFGGCGHQRRLGVGDTRPLATMGTPAKTPLPLSLSTVVSTSSLHQLALLTRHSNKLLTNCSITLLKPPSVKLFLFVFFRSFELNECFPDCVYSELYQWKFAHNNMTAIIVPFCVNFRLHLRRPGARGGRPRQE